MSEVNPRFVAKSTEQRKQFNDQADAEAREAALIEEKLRREDLPFRQYPFQGPIEHQDIVVERVMVPMRDCVALRTHVYRPAKEGKYPVVMLRGPYDMNSTLDSAPALLRNLARRGYVGVAQDVRGRFGSEGVFRALVHEHEDTFDAVEWAAVQNWSNGRVGITGISYIGFTSYCAGIMRPRGLAAIMPSCTKYGGEHLVDAPALSAMCTWFVWAGQPTPVLQNFRRIDWLHLPLNQIDDEAGLSHPNFKIQVEQQSGVPGYLGAAEIEKRLANIEVPTYVVAGWYDEFLTESLMNYERQARNSPDVRLFVGPWHHNLEDIQVASIGLVPTPDKFVDRYYHEMEQFFDHHLKHSSNTPMPSPGRVLLYVMGTNQWRYENEWPLARAETKSIYLGSGGKANTDKGDGQLSWSAPAGDQPTDNYDYNPLDPVRSVEGLGAWNLLTVGRMSDRSAIESRADVLVYTSPVLDEDLEVTGTVRATLYASTSAPDTDFVINLVDVYPNGHTQYLCNGLVRVSYHDGSGERKLVEPGKVYEYQFDLRPTSNCFQKGHRIRIEVTSSDMDRYARNQNVADAPGTTANVAIARQAIYHSGNYASRLDLLVVGKS
ncbi:MAG: CocE/NonD family hydrolase [Planctomycetota bacterium]